MRQAGPAGIGWWSPASRFWRCPEGVQEEPRGGRRKSPEGDIEERRCPEGGRSPEGDVRTSPEGDRR